MGESISDAAAEINDLLREVSEKLERMKKAKNLDKLAKNEGIGIMKNRMERARKALKTMGIEIRELPRVDQKPHNDKAAEFEKSINDLANEVNWFEQGDASASGAPGPGILLHSHFSFLLHSVILILFFLIIKYVLSIFSITFNTFNGG